MTSTSNTQHLLPTGSDRDKHVFYSQPAADGTKKVYVPDDDLLHAANTALILGRPLLLAGEPGCGKSQFAWVLANELTEGAPLLRCQVRSDSQASDLLYRYDAMLRFRDSQYDKARAADPRRYVRLQELGLAMVSSKRRVVLVDEIDKAPRDLPNDLLLEFEQGYFEIPELRGFESEEVVVDKHSDEGVAVRYKMEPSPSAPRAIVVITSNAERQLPEPFLRRCVFFHIPRLGPRQLERIALARFGSEPELVRPLAKIFATLREEMTGIPDAKLPSTAEMLDWITLVRALKGRASSRVGAILEYASAIGGPEEAPRLDTSKKKWSDLPGLECLVKLTEDLEGLGA